MQTLLDTVNITLELLNEHLYLKALLVLLAAFALAGLIALLLSS